MSGKQFGNVSEYDVGIRDIEQAVKAIEQSFDGVVEVRLVIPSPKNGLIGLWLACEFCKGQRRGADDVTAECSGLIPNDRTKTISGSMLWYLCELYDKLEAAESGVTVHHPKAFPRWTAHYWTKQR